MAVMLSNNGNMPQHDYRHTRPNVIRLAFRLTGAGADAGGPVDKDAGQLGCAIYSVSRTSEGLYVITPNRKFNGAIEGVSIGLVGPTVVHAKLTELDLTAPTMTLKVYKMTDGSVDDLETTDSCYINIDVRTNVNN